MADNIKLVTYSGSTVAPLDDALVYEKAVGQSGIIYGAEITLKNTNTLHINAGHGVVCGRKFTIVDSDIPVQLTAGTTNPGRVYIHLDLSNTTEPIQIMTEVAATLTAPIQQEDVNINNGVYEFNMATFTIDAQTISEVVNVFPSIENTTGNLSDLTTEDKTSLVAAVNEVNKKGVPVLDTPEEIMANTSSGKAAGALGVKKMFAEVSDSLVASDGLNFKFATDGEGNYGYLGADDSFVPFKSSGDLEIGSITAEGYTGVTLSYVSKTGKNLVVATGSRYGQKKNVYLNCACDNENSIVTTIGSASRMNIDSSYSSAISVFMVECVAGDTITATATGDVNVNGGIVIFDL